MTHSNREIRLKTRPAGLPASEHFELVETAPGTPGPGQILVRNLWMSVDPYMRGRMDERKSYITPFELGVALEGAAIGTIEQSNDAAFTAGDLVVHFAG